MAKENKKEVLSCLKPGERIIVRFVAKENDSITDRKHVAYGGMMDNAIRGFNVPMLSSGVYKNVLTNDEKDFLEQILGLEPNALSVYNKKNNYWDYYVVRLTKTDTILDLGDPEDYIKYKVLLANDMTIAKSAKALQENYKATYQYVILEPNEELKDSASRVDNLMKCYEEFGAIRDNYYILKAIIETLDGRPIAANTKIEFLQGKITDLITNNPVKFLKVAKDPLLPTKVLIGQAVEKGVISKRGDYYYLREDGSPLCSNGEDPTISIAATYLSLPKNQELRLAIKNKLD